MKAQRAVLPKDLPILIVGGVRPEAMGEWLEAGANGFGVGSGVFKPGDDAARVLEKTRAYVSAQPR